MPQFDRCAEQSAHLLIRFVMRIRKPPGLLKKPADLQHVVPARAMQYWMLCKPSTFSTRPTRKSGWGKDRGRVKAGTAAMPPSGGRSRRVGIPTPLARIGLDPRNELKRRAGSPRAVPCI